MQPSQSLLPAPAGTLIPIASPRPVYSLGDVEKRLSKLPVKDHEPLRHTYERMLEMGPDRFHVKPSGLPAMDRLYEELPNFREPLDDVRRQLALCQGTSDPLEITPMLLVGPPGVGKTHFAREITQLLGTGLGFVSMSSLTAGWILSGASSQWKGARPGKVFDVLVDGFYADPVMVVDEIDKASSDQAYDPLGALYSLLEHDTSTHFTDEFAEVAIDASQLIWVATANHVRSIPDPILNRMNVYEVQPPDPHAARAIAIRLYTSITSSHEWGSQFSKEPSEEVLAVMSAMAPREMRRAWMTALGNARLAKHSRVELQDIPERRSGRNPMGFAH